MDRPDSRLAAFGDQLIDVHDWLRAELARLSDDVDAYLDGGARPKDLRAYCLTFCAALERHHSGEDDGAFPALADGHPELAPILGKLREDHQLVSDILRRLRDLVDGLTPQTAADPRRARQVRGEVDGLRALMESHFSFEERSIIETLNALNVPAWRDDPPAFLQKGH